MVASWYGEFLKEIDSIEENILVFTPNPEIFVCASKDEEFYDILKKATYNVPDGVGLYLWYELAKWKNIFESWYRFLFKRNELVQKYWELIKGSDLTRDILELASDEKRKILIIDKKIVSPRNDLEKNKQDVQKLLKELLEKKYSNIEVSVIFHDDMSPDAIAHFIEVKEISHVFCCLGMKTQEKALINIWNYLPTYTKVAGFWVGASIDFLLGVQKRAPKIFQKLGLEWLYRLSMAPRTRIKRIWSAVVEFPLLARKR